jgi:serine/threonine protein kinase
VINIKPQIFNGAKLLVKVSLITKIKYLILNYIGAFGNVKIASLKKDKTKKFALKAMKKDDIIKSKHVDHIENEKKILEIMDHPFIVSTIVMLNFNIDEILWFHAR